ncbi:hypothetical protein ABMA28_010140 [Loxostege sticticalis]|uniref:Uncharacterized protein n=1 Tax=Loxostege sticticalis TaxID=481309 RepID=A0ABD0S9U8_LOXSC
MLQQFLILIMVCDLINSVDLYDDESDRRAFPITDMEFEPVTNRNKDKDKILLAAIMYNSSRKSPPMPLKIGDWCKAIRHLTNCAIDWNSDCREVTESHFNEESIKGHMHVVDNVCDDEWFLSRKLARAQFRRCTLDSLFSSPSRCTHEQSTTLQKFSVIVSEGDVFQDCDFNMMYSNCPAGDPRPSKTYLAKLMNIAPVNESSGAPNKDGISLKNLLLRVVHVIPYLV